MAVTILKAVVVLIIGFVLLVKGADFFVEGASSVAKMLKVPSLIIGMTIVAMGTSLPETSVSIAASMNNQNTLAVSNVVGSNIFNLMVVLGICAVISKLQVSRDVLKRDYPFSVLCAILLLVCGCIGMELGRIDGIVFLVIFVGFIVVLIKSAMDARKRGEISEKEREMKEQPVWKSIIYIVGGAIAIKYGGDWVVDSASTIATSFGISATLVGLTICSVGTSLPELVTSIVAARKNELDMAVGNVVGSNVFNILMVLGVAATISPITFLMENVIDIIVLLVFSLITWVFCITKKEIGKKEGIIMLVLYAIYLVYICLR